MALYATCMPLPSDTFHDKLFASSLHVTKVMMLIMIMTTRRGCGSLCNLHTSAVGHLS